MSKVVSPVPAYKGEITPPANASWWRLRLEPNQDNIIMFLETDARDSDMQGATWCSWEFFDGHDTIIDTGFDHPTKARLFRRGKTEYIDVLSDGPPTPCGRWWPLNEPGDWVHPDDII